MKPVIPSYITYETGHIKPFLDSAELIPLSCLLCASLELIKVTLNIMPEFRPNQTMLDKHSDDQKNGQKDWEIFANCVRDAISEQSGLPKWDKNCSLRENKAYEEVMQGKTDEINGVTIEFIDGPATKTRKKFN